MNQSTVCYCYVKAFRNGSAPQWGTRSRMVPEFHPARKGYFITDIIRIATAKTSHSFQKPDADDTGQKGWKTTRKKHQVPWTMEMIHP